MWKFKHFAHKEQTGLEGRVIDIGNYKVQVRNAIAEGGFSCVYLARDATHGSKQYALKHIICNDEESQELVIKEISVMKSLRGHPNVVTLNAHAFFDMGRTKEALLLMEYCEKSLVNTLESRGAGLFEEKQILTIFKDVCNAVFAMHCQTPPIAHRDLKAENLLLGSDGSWKLCDFGSTSINHKRFEKPEEMGIEEDNIRKYTTPAYRAPEMWDLFRRELISEKVDIWALGCLLFRICYFKPAFDGESKLQILNGNYRIPDLPRYNASLTDLIKDMLQSSPDDRPDITQLWFRVNDLLPDGLQKSLPDRPPEMPQQGTDLLAGIAKPTTKSNPMPRRSPPPPPSAEASRNVSSLVNNPNASESIGALGAFWTTQHAKDSVSQEDNTRPKFDESNNKINLFPDDLKHSTEKVKPSKAEGTLTVQNYAYNTFVAEFTSINKQSPISNHKKSEDELEAEVEKLKEQLSSLTTEKAEIATKYEKLSAICRSQRQEIQDLKQALAVKTQSPSRDSSRNLSSPASQPSTTLQNEKIEGTVWELQEGFYDRRSPSPDSQQWQAFSDDSKPTNNTPRSVRTKNGLQNKQTAEVTPATKTWEFGTDNFTAVPTASSRILNAPPVRELNNSQRFGEPKSMETNPAPQISSSAHGGFKSYWPGFNMDLF